MTDDERAALDGWRYSFPARYEGLCCLLGDSEVTVGFKLSTLQTVIKAHSVNSHYILSKQCFTQSHYLFGVLALSQVILLGETSRNGSRLRPVRSFSSSNNSKTALPKITKFYTDIHTDIIYSPTEYDVITYFWSEAIGKNSRKYRL